MTADSYVLGGDGWWRAPGRAPIRALDNDGYLPGVTRPTALNMGSRKGETQLANYAGTFTNVQAGEQIRDLYITTTGGLVLREPDVLVEDCIVDVRAPDLPATDPTVVHGITSWTNRSTATVRHTTIRCRPEYRSWRIGAGIHGSGLDISRVRITGMTDGVMGSGVNKRSYVRVRDFLIEDLPHYDYDGHSSHPSHPAGLASFPGSHADGSHPDGVQFQGNLTEAVLSGGLIETAYTASVIVTQDAGTYGTPPRLEDLWLPLGYSPFGSIVNVKLSDPPIPGLSIKRCRFTAQQLSRARIILSPEQLAVADITSAGPDGNVWLDEPGVTKPTANTGQVLSVPVYRGPGVSPSNLYTYGVAA